MMMWATAERLRPTIGVVIYSGTRARDEYFYVPQASHCLLPTAATSQLEGHRAGPKAAKTGPKRTPEETLRKYFWA